MGNKHHSQNTSFVNLLGWGLMLILVGVTAYQIKGTVRDLSVLLNNDSSTALTLVITVPLMTIVLTPIVLTIGFLRRRNWGTIGYNDNFPARCGYDCS
jgi:hypothetical protein